MPHASIVITSFNQLGFLQQAIDSARAQTLRDCEVIVVDDASTDGSVDYLRGQSDLVVLFNPENRGRSYSRNRGWQAAVGRYVAFLDGDDVLLPEKMEKQAAFLEAHPGTGMVFGDMQVCDRDGNSLPVLAASPPPLFRGGDIFEALSYRNFIPVGSQLVRREALTVVGGFDEAMRPAEDWQLWLRLAAVCAIQYEAVTVAKYRLHDDNTTKRRLSRTYGNAMVKRWLIASPPLYERLSDSAKYACCISAAISLIKIGEPEQARRILTAARAMRYAHPAAYVIGWLSRLGPERFSRLTDWGRAARHWLRPNPYPYY